MTGMVCECQVSYAIIPSPAESFNSLVFGRHIRLTSFRLKIKTVSIFDSYVNINIKHMFYRLQLHALN